MSEAIRIAVAGLGTVGAGVIKIMAERGDVLALASGREIEIVAVSARDADKDRGIDISRFRFEPDARALAVAADIDVVVELIGGADGIAYDLVEAALSNGKHVVTANKALIARHGAHLAQIAEDKNVALNFEAGVAGGIPIVKALREGLVANQISNVTGILNGTCNYILTEMEETGRDFEDVLVDAQELGYAEADPSFDVGGIDAAHKLAILTSLAFGTKIDFAQVQIEGIEKISATDIYHAAEFGYRIKLLGIAEAVEGGIAQSVQPTLVPFERPLAAVPGVYNAVAVTGNYVGDVILEGRGAGQGPTASAVVSDIVDVARGFVFPPFIIPSAKLRESRVPPKNIRKSAYYLRLYAIDRAGSMAEITRALALASISIERIVQSGERMEAGSGRLPVVFMTHATDEATMREAMILLAEHADVAGEPVMMRIDNSTTQ